LPQLDTMLKALAERGANELRLADGARPVFRYGDGDRPVSQAVLARARIVTLLQEICADRDRGRLVDGGPFKFTYQIEGGKAFVCEVGADPAIFARVFLDDGPAPKAEPPVPVATAPRPAPIPVAALPEAADEDLGALGSLTFQPRQAAAAAAASSSAPSAPDAILEEDDGEVVFAAPVQAESRIETSPAQAKAAAEVVAADGPGPIEALLRRLVEIRASDLHLSPDEYPMVRLHGEMTRWDDVGVHAPADTERILRPIIPPRYAEEFAERNDTDFAHEIPDVARFRCNIFRDRKGMGAVFRVIPSKIPSAQDLGIPRAVLELCHLTKGLVLVTGPTGSGKSTTLAALVDYINSNRTDHIITIEDPIEFVHQNRKCLVNQREVGSHTASFKAALRAALREDPDIVLVGEMRDLETIAIAIETAETGHLVFGTLHTSTAASTVDRIIDQFPADRQAQIRVMLSESLRGVISQTLCRRIGVGRVAALEILIGNQAIANLIREGKSYQIPSIMQTAKKQGMILLNEALLDLVKKKLITPEEAWLKSLDKNGITSGLKTLGFEPPTIVQPA